MLSSDDSVESPYSVLWCSIIQEDNQERLEYPFLSFKWKILASVSNGCNADSFFHLNYLVENSTNRVLRKHIAVYPGKCLHFLQEI